MRRFVTLVFLLLFTIPFGISISGCSKSSPITYCEGSSGPIVGQATTVTLTPKIFGISMNFAQISQVNAPAASDCKGTAVTISSYTYGVFDANGKANMTIADVVPTTGRLCAGTWNRNSGGGIPDFTTCNPTNQSGTVYVVATGNGANSNPLPIFVHPVVTSVVLGNATPTANCSTDPDPSSNCCPLAAQATVTAPPYSPNSCLSQGQTGQLVARAYKNATTNPADNITCQVGHLTYAAQTGGVVTIDENGVATAQAPGSSVVSATISNASSSAGFFSTCPPVSIALSIPNTSNATSVVVNQNNLQPINVVAKDINNTILTGLSLEFVSTTPSTIPAAATGSVTPSFPGAAQITAICQPPTCNPSSFNQIGLLGNGMPVTSNPITVTTPGTNSTLLYIGSTQSRYLVPVDFTTNAIGAPVKLPYVPNSMVISADGTNIYMGSDTELMVFSGITNSVTKQDTTVTGNVLAVSPDGTTLVITDPVRQLIYLYNATSNTLSAPSQGGVGTHAQFSPDSQTVYITTGTVTTPASPGTPATSTTPAIPPTPAVIAPSNQLLVHSTFTGWTTIALGAPAADVAVTVPSVGAYLASSNTTALSYCSANVSPTGAPLTNNFFPLADTTGVATDRVGATNDGLHILGATTANLVDLGFNPTATTTVPAGLPIGPCPIPVPSNYFTSSRTSTTTAPLGGITATAINGVVPASDSSVAIVTYAGTGGVLPVYKPVAGGAGSVSNVPLLQVTGQAAPVAPVAGVISSDNTTIYVGTSGDNSVHLINNTTLTDDTTKTIAPNLLQNINGVDQNTIATPNLIVQHPKKLQS
jgi:trimeric autotransporter adhesin